MHAVDLDRQLAGRLTVQLIEADAARRDANARILVERIRAIPGVTQMTSSTASSMSVMSLSVSQWQRT